MPWSIYGGMTQLVNLAYRGARARFYITIEPETVSKMDRNTFPPTSKVISHLNETVSIMAVYTPLILHNCRHTRSSRGGGGEGSYPEVDIATKFSKPLPLLPLPGLPKTTTATPLQVYKLGKRYPLLRYRYFFYKALPKRYPQCGISLSFSNKPEIKLHL